jgi:hypothetical protein
MFGSFQPFQADAANGAMVSTPRQQLGQKATGARGEAGTRPQNLWSSTCVAMPYVAPAPVTKVVLEDMISLSGQLLLVWEREPFIVENPVGQIVSPTAPSIHNDDVARRARLCRLGLPCFGGAPRTGKRNRGISRHRHLLR